ncbi:MAG: HisA/HisF-related TIM barrel protein [Acidimicrobiales bacterium]
MDLFPAIDLLDGRCVRLYQGDYQRETVYGEDPVVHAQAFARAGARWIHVVDLGAARTGEPTNRDAIAAITAAVDVPVQTGGGVRSVGAAEALFAAGVTRVVLGTAALESPGFVRRLADRHPVAVGLDVRGREVAIRGWEHGSGTDVVDLLGEFEGSAVAAFVVTQISRDGTLEGPTWPVWARSSPTPRRPSSPRVASARSTTSEPWLGCTTAPDAWRGPSSVGRSTSAASPWRRPWPPSTRRPPSRLPARGPRCRCGRAGPGPAGRRRRR